MARSEEPLENLPDNARYSESRDYSRGDAGQYMYQGVTLEEEAACGGWLPNARPTGPEPIDLFTTGMRGEPTFDDDPQFDDCGQISHSESTES